MPCFIRITRKLGIQLPTDPAFNGWFERELMQELDTITHEDLRNRLVYYEIYHPEQLKEIIQQILQRWRKKKITEKPLAV